MSGNPDAFPHFDTLKLGRLGQAERRNFLQVEAKSRLFQASEAPRISCAFPQPSSARP